MTCRGTQDIGVILVHVCEWRRAGRQANCAPACRVGNQSKEGFSGSRTCTLGTTVCVKARGKHDTYCRHAC